MVGRVKEVVEEGVRKLQGDDLDTPLKQMADADARRLLWAVMKNEAGMAEVDKPLQVRHGEKLHHALQASLHVIMEGQYQRRPYEAYAGERPLQSSPPPPLPPALPPRPLHILSPTASLRSSSSASSLTSPSSPPLSRSESSTSALSPSSPSPALVAELLQQLEAQRVKMELWAQRMQEEMEGRKAREVEEEVQRRRQLDELLQERRRREDEEAGKVSQAALQAKTEQLERQVQQLLKAKQPRPEEVDLTVDLGDSAQVQQKQQSLQRSAALAPTDKRAPHSSSNQQANAGVEELLRAVARIDLQLQCTTERVEQVDASVSYQLEQKCLSLTRTTQRRYTELKQDMQDLGAVHYQRDLESCQREEDLRAEGGQRPPAPSVKPATEQQRKALMVGKETRQGGGGRAVKAMPTQPRVDVEERVRLQRMEREREREAEKKARQAALEQTTAALCGVVRRPAGGDFR